MTPGNLEVRADFLKVDIRGGGAIQHTRPRPAQATALRVEELCAVWQRITETDKTQTLRELNQIKKSDNAVVFVHVDWAPMLKEFFDEFVADYSSVPSNPKVSFHYVDFTPIDHDYKPLTGWPGWNRLGKQMGGWSEMVWVKNGTVVDMERAGHFSSTDEAVNRTTELFSQ